MRIEGGGDGTGFLLLKDDFLFKSFERWIFIKLVRRGMEWNHRRDEEGYAI